MARQVTLRLSSVEQLFISRNRKVVTQSSRWGNTGVWLLVLVAAGFIFSSVLWAWANLQQTNLNYQISHYQETQKQYLDLNEKLRLELSSLTSIRHLEKLAAENGMGPPQPCQVVRLP